MGMGSFRGPCFSSHTGKYTMEVVGNTAMYAPLRTGRESKSSRERPITKTDRVWVNGAECASYNALVSL
ncbi:MAG: hypothetical protein ACI9HK_003591 [Pirellulaceae bacterium]|jgi:hypothetical protein